MLDELLELTNIPDRVVELVDKFDKLMRHDVGLTKGQLKLIGELSDEYVE